MEDDFERIMEMVGASPQDAWGVKIDPACSLDGMSEILQLFGYLGIFSNGRVGQCYEILLVYGDADEHSYALVSTVISFLTAILKGRDTKPFWVYGYRGKNGILIKVVGEVFISVVETDFCRDTGEYSTIIGDDRMMFYRFF